MSTRLKRILRYALFMGILVLVYTQGWHKPVVATLQRGILKTGIMNPQLKEVPDTNGKTRVKGTKGEAVVPGDLADLNVQFFDENDQLVSLADMPKKPYFINFWATRMENRHRAYFSRRINELLTPWQDVLDGNPSPATQQIAEQAMEDIRLVADLYAEIRFEKRNLT